MTRLRRPFIALSCTWMVFVATAVGWAQESSGRDLAALEGLAEERYAEGNLAGAAELYGEIADRIVDPRARAQALFTASWLHHLNADQASAIESLIRALKLDPDHPFDPSLYNQSFELLYERALDIADRERRREAAERVQAALAELEAGRAGTARGLLDSALELAPDHPAALYNLALLDLRDGSTAGLVTAFERVVSLTYRETSQEMSELRAKALASIGIVYRRQGRLEDAEEAFLAATRTDPREAVAWKNLGFVRIEQQEFAAAAGALERAHKLLPDDTEATLALSRALAESGRAGEAEQLLRAALERRPEDAELWLELGRLELGRRAAADAIRDLARAMSADPDNGAGFAAPAATLLATAYLDEGQLEAALEAANRAVGWAGSSSEAWRALGRCQLAAGNASQAIASLGRSAELDPSAAGPLSDLGDAHAAAGQLQEAEAVYLRALSLAPDSAEVTDRLEEVRSRRARERAIVLGRAKPRKPIPPKKIGLEFASLDYKDLHLRGALVKQVKHKSPAARAGLRQGDLVLWIGDYAVLSDKDFYQYLKRNPPRDRLQIEYLRDGRIHGVDIELR